MNFVLRGLRNKYLTVLMQMEMWWLIFCKCENLFKSNGLNFPLFPVRERNCVKIKNKRQSKKWKKRISNVLIKVES